MSVEPPTEFYVNCECEKLFNMPSIGVPSLATIHKGSNNYSLVYSDSGVAGPSIEI